MSRIFEIAVGEAEPHGVDVARHGDRATVTIDGRHYRGSLRPAGDGYELTLEDRTEPMWILRRPRHRLGARLRARLADLESSTRSSARAPARPPATSPTAPMPGTRDHDRRRVRPGRGRGRRSS